MSRKPRISQSTNPTPHGLTLRLATLHLLALLHYVLGIAGPASVITKWLWQHADPTCAILLVIPGSILGTIIATSVSLTWCEVVNDFAISAIICWPKLVHPADFHDEALNAVYKSLGDQKYDPRFLESKVLHGPRVSSNLTLFVTAIIVLISLFNRTILDSAWHLFLKVEGIALICLVVYFVITYFHEEFSTEITPR